MTGDGGVITDERQDSTQDLSFGTKTFDPEVPGSYATLAVW